EGRDASTAAELRSREAQSPLSMTGFLRCCTRRSEADIADDAAQHPSAAKAGLFFLAAVRHD
ncbi:MAG: hypothetical protein WBW38_18580, partial [Candidatus Sulfotelmatobacter sp.]